MRKLIFALSVFFLSAGFLSVFSPAAIADDDPPGRVARLNYIQGSISYQPGGENDWVQANPNRPLTTGDNLWADRNSRGELHIGSASFRIGSETGITFLNLNDRTIQIQLAQGSLNVHVRRLEGGDAFEIDTPNLAFTLERPGDYRVDVNPDGASTRITVRQGEGEATGGGNEFHMDSGDQATFDGTDNLTFHAGQARGYDDFDEWCRGRDEREERSISARYVSRDIDGYQDLDDYGEWRDVPDYGEVWFPASVNAGWAPYRYGHWVWIAPWGWTWVEDEPWGFAPFHYGRWAVYNGAWGWVPGPVVVRPVYAPALVVFVGGSHFGASVSFGGGGGVGWFPLGPREVYIPPYRTSPRYVQNVNVTNTTVNVTNVTNVYNNVTVNNVNVNKITYMHQNNVNAVTVVNHDTFVNARPVAPATVRVTPQQIQTAEVQRTVAVAPVQKSVVGSAPAATVRPPQAVMQRQVVVKETPAVPRTPAYNPPPQAKFNPASGAPPKGQPQQQTPQPQNTQSQPQIQSRQQQATTPQQPRPASQSQPDTFSRQPSGPPQGFHPPTQQATTPQQPRPASEAQPQSQSRQPSGPPQGFRPPNGQQQQQQSRTQPSAPQPPPQPNVRYAPPPQANEQTYHPHQFEKPQSATPAQNERPQERPQERPAPPQERAAPPQEHSQPRAQENNHENNHNGGEERKQQQH